MNFFYIKNRFLAKLITCMLVTAFALPVVKADESDPTEPQTPNEFLNEAVKMNSFGLASLAIKSGATNINDVLLNLCEHSHYYSVDCGIRVIEFVEFLLGYGADVNTRQKDTDRTPLMCVCNSRIHERGSYTVDSDLVGVLLRHRANVNAQDFHGWAPLMFACDNNNFKVSKILLDHGADVNASQVNGYTPLIFSARAICGGEMVETVGLLLENGADVNKHGDDGESALSLVGKIILHKNLYVPEYVEKAKKVFGLLSKAIAEQRPM